ncbi:hypothetical protein [Limosilactobacillus reuteri]|uniref:hypothetical protein n=1 Tax=Limosilactobacillus reuteri TaxID=1598 RepID=UPI0011D04299|nr:hypothetical protein [Limosilactobacillus reuteri]
MSGIININSIAGATKVEITVTRECSIRPLFKVNSVIITTISKVNIRSTSAQIDMGVYPRNKFTVLIS